jgi:hypothetical protein
VASAHHLLRRALDAGFRQWKIIWYWTFLELHYVAEYIKVQNVVTFHDRVCVAGSVYGGYDNPKLTYDGHVKMWQGSNKISILSSAVGLPVS